MAFDETQFPSDISRGATSSPGRLTEVFTLRSGFEERNTSWSDSRRSFNAGLGLRGLEDIYDTVEFWEGRRGALRGFRFKDWADFKSGSPSGTITSTDEETDALSANVFQLQKVYSPLANPWTREIAKPIAPTVLASDDTGDLIVGTDFVVDNVQGRLVFATAPTGTVKAGFEFDTPVRFQDEAIQVNVALVDVGSMPTVNMIEVRIALSADLTEYDEVIDLMSVYTGDEYVAFGLAVDDAVNTKWTENWN